MSLRRWRVQRGIRFLDKHVGRDVWLPRVDADYLSVRSCNDCPLAQATGKHFWTAARSFSLNDTFVGDFRLTLLGFLRSPGESWLDLDLTWHAELAALHASRRVSVT